MHEILRAASKTDGEVTAIAAALGHSDMAIQSVDDLITNQLRRIGGLESLQEGVSTERVDRDRVRFVAVAAAETAGDDAADAKFWPIDTVLSGELTLAGDHLQILKNWLL